MRPLRRGSAALSLAMLASQAACAPTVPPPRAAVSPPQGGSGVILAERPVPATDPATRDAILRRLGVSPADADGAGSVEAGLVEFVVGDATGRVLSVVQPNPAHLRPGERVAIRWQPRTLLLPAATEVAAAPGQ